MIRNEREEEIYIEGRAISALFHDDIRPILKKYYNKKTNSPAANFTGIFYALVFELANLSNSYYELLEGDFKKDFKKNTKVHLIDMFDKCMDEMEKN